MFAQVTVGKKLGVGIGAKLASTLALGYVAWHAVNNLSQELDQAVTRTAVKLDLAQAIGKRVQESVCACRGAALSYINQNPPRMEANQAKMRDASSRIHSQITDITPLLSPEGRKHMDVIV
jgi:hypothetical protein